MTGERILPARALTVAQAASEVVAEQRRELKRQARLVRDATDPEAVHQMRVATRRLRAALRVFRAHLRVPHTVARGLRRLARRLGAVRDCDVLIALAETKHLGALRGAERERMARLVGRWRRRRERAQDRLVQELQRARHRALLKALTRFAKHPEPAAPHEAVAARVLSDAVDAQAERLARHPGMTLPAPAPAALHDLRIGFKRLRYTLDFHAAAFGLSYDEERRLARQMQEVLGEIHDRDLLLDRLATGKGAWKGPWPGLHRRLATERQALIRRFLRLRQRWNAQTRVPDADDGDGRFVSLEPATVRLRLVAGGRHVAHATL